VAGYAESIQTVFLVAVPIAALAFLATWLIPQVELKQWPEAGSAASEADTPAAVGTEAPRDATASRSPAEPSVALETLDPQDATKFDR
jgi:hypothetical protein